MSTEVGWPRVRVWALAAETAKAPRARAVGFMVVLVWVCSE
jgi:hypothetical protein